MIKAMAVALSSPGVAFRSPALSSSSGLSAATRNPTLQHYTRYDVAELKTAVLAMEDLQLNTSGCTLTATREKYNQAKFKSVAKLASPKRVTPLFSG
ncbi:hypothetical protein F2Q69_00045043 [Brassica cretica]|uniref:Cyclin C-terminal domain-containing protein n=1 Tax=Brassica cretica TaxID=69181 RepID=A0A8S9NFU3_BRACR|nr:hypothetical protein F2Q69_00045043 [Brassica cretica]